MIRRRTPLARARRRINAISTTRRRSLNAYAKAARAWKAQPENRACRFPGCRRPATDIHHTRGRIGSLLTDTRFWVPVCRSHHDWIGANPASARDLGLLAPLGQWNRKHQNHELPA